MKVGSIPFRKLPSTILSPIAISSPFPGTPHDTNCPDSISILRWAKSLELIYPFEHRPSKLFLGQILLGPRTPIKVIEGYLNFEFWIYQINICIFFFFFLKMRYAFLSRHKIYLSVSCNLKNIYSMIRSLYYFNCPFILSIK